jgi:opacity protein-like surface antigen
MKKLLGPAVLLLLCSLPTFAQDEESKVEVGGGYTFRSFLPPTPGAGIPNPRLDMSGWNATVSFDINRWLTVATDADGTYQSSAETPPLTGNTQTSIYSVVAGPRIYPLGHHKLAPFAHVMFGLAHARITSPTSTGCGTSFSCTFTDGSFDFEAGGGVDLNVSKHLAIRFGEFDYERTSFLSFSTYPLSDVSNNFKYKAAVLFRF